MFTIAAILLFLVDVEEGAEDAQGYRSDESDAENSSSD